MVRLSKQSLALEELQKIIPHRPPFVLIDGVKQVKFGVFAEGFVKDIGAYPFFQQLKQLQRDDKEFILIDGLKVDLKQQKAFGLITKVQNLMPLFTGHFPGRPVFPGALTLAAVAETAYHLLQQLEPDKEGLFLKNLSRWRFKRLIEPGDQVELQVEVAENDVFRGQAIVANQVAASGSLTFSSSKEVEGNAGGSLPGATFLPAALLVEALAEVGAVAVLGLEENKGKVAFLASLDKWEFKQAPKAGQQLTLKAALVDLRRSFGKGQFTASSENEEVAFGEMMFGLGETA